MKVVFKGLSGISVALVRLEYPLGAWVLGFSNTDAVVRAIIGIIIGIRVMLDVVVVVVALRGVVTIIPSVDVVDDVMCAA